MKVIRLLCAFDKAFENKAYRRRLIVRAIEDAIVLFKLCLYTALACLGTTLVFRLLGVE